MDGMLLWGDPVLILVASGSQSENGWMNEGRMARRSTHERPQSALAQFAPELLSNASLDQKKALSYLQTPEKKKTNSRDVKLDIAGKGDAELLLSTIRHSDLQLPDIPASRHLWPWRRSAR